MVKIGIKPFTYTEPIKGISKHRLKGTLVIKIVEVINKEEVREMIIEMVILAIRGKFPKVSKSYYTYIPHLTVDDANIKEECASKKLMEFAAKMSTSK